MEKDRDGNQKNGKKTLVKQPVKPQKHKTEDAEVMLRKLLKEKHFLPKSPDVKIAWEVFKEMFGLRFECSEDELLFETGIYEFSGKEMFWLSIVRQFTIVEEDGEYDYMEQLHMDFLYEPQPELMALAETIWTYDFDDDSGRFFEAVEQSPAFCVPRDRFAPVKFELYFDEV